MKTVTANRLDDGAVVYLADDDRWTSDINAAARFADDDSKSVLAAAQLRVKEIADAYLVDIDESGALTGRETLRETIRKAGPTVRADLGYQAGAAS
ncbi:DUF2849 domain-containing protein [Hyphococcus sp.]|uniref:DUF2849 domain-containing protein n=1 Tax=Hyphococcus sp. TaxID=2038636 RepID=UPI00208D1F21|nr:MAG: hypothetical protein DHS20C04_06300 [Marinicaulis sp.]